MSNERDVLAEFAGHPGWYLLAYIIVELLKAALFSKRRREDQDTRDAMKCKYRQDDHIKLSDVFLFSKAEDIFLKDLRDFQVEHRDNFRRVIDEIRTVIKEFNDKLK